MSESTQLQQTLLQARESLALAQAQVGKGINPNDPFIKAKEAQIARLEAQIPTLQNELTAVNNLNAVGTASAGQVVRDDGAAGIQNPPLATTANGRVTNVEQTNQQVLDSQYVATNGTSAQTLTTTNSQATPAGNVPVFTSAQVNQDLTGGAGIAEPARDAGVGAQRDDNTAPNTNTTQQAVNASFNKPITAQPNVLDNFVDYTYSISWYLLTPDQFSQMQTSGTQNINSWQLLIQSGGIPVGSRNQFFKQDYYIDNLEVKAAIHGKGTNSAHNATELSWTVTEPNGLTLLNNLYSAVTNLYKQAGLTDNPNYVKATYVIVIRFYGYDENGKLDLKVGKRGTNGNVNLTDPSAVVEKFYPVLISNISFQLANKAVEYKVEATPIPYKINRGTFNATIPFNYELVGTTLKDIFTGKATNVTTTTDGNVTTVTTTTVTNQPTGIPEAPSNASSAPNGTTNNVFTGLCEALNAHQRQLVKDGIYEVADQYSIEFASSSLANAQIKKPGNTDFSATPMQQANTPAGQLDPSKNSVNTAGRTVPVTAGMQITQFLDQQIRASTYISDQMTYITDEVTGQQVPNLKNVNGQTAWYKINFQATPIPGKYDNKRRDHAYKIKYIISPYAINTMQSEYFADSKFRGVHKSYNYWFTGKNTQVLNYSQTINSLYAVVMTGKQSVNAELVTGRDQIPRTYLAASEQSSQGADKGANEPAASGASYLYSMADLANINLRIVGDPAWLQQGEAAGRVIGSPFNFNPFNDDGTINFDASQITFDISWNSPVDYNYEKGIMEVSGPAAASGTLNQPQEHATYLATEVKSMFTKGKFEQELQGTIIPQSVTKSKVTTNTEAASATSPTNPATAPLSADVAAAQLSLPSFAGIGNAFTALGNYIRDPLKNITSDGRITQNAPNASTTDAAAGEAVQPAIAPLLPATAPTPPPRSDGDIRTTQNAQPNQTQAGIPSSIQQTTSVTAAANNTLTSLLPTWPSLPIRSATESLQQYQAKLLNIGTQQVNTTPPQKLNKSDE